MSVEVSRVDAGGDRGLKLGAELSLDRLRRGAAGARYVGPEIARDPSVSPAERGGEVSGRQR
jgi:hypothetical protein